jgi:two-component system sensor histidine kinase PhoQ
MTRRWFGQSLSSRLLRVSLIVLPFALGIAGVTLERAYRLALDASIADKMQLQILTLLSQFEFDGLSAQPFVPTEPRFVQLQSGLYAMVTDVREQVIWLSPSAALLPNPVQTLGANAPTLPVGQHKTLFDKQWTRQVYQVLWELDSGRATPLRFLLVEDAEPRLAQLATYRQQLLLSLLLTFLALLFIQWFILRWGLRPLSSLAERLERREAGDAVTLQGDWPKEVAPLVANLELLLEGEENRRARLRNTLADLAHSLKTPLAVLRNSQIDDPQYPAVLQEQLGRMQEVIEWQLQRVSGGATGILMRVDVALVVERLAATLAKVYADRNISLRYQCAAQAVYRGDERDLMEILGNLLDNAFKYARKSVCITITVDSSLVIVIEDDGEGMSPDWRDALLQRGMRADQRRPGQGIGLAVALDIVAANGGTLSLDDSDLGGAKIVVCFPM